MGYDTADETPTVLARPIATPRPTTLLDLIETPQAIRWWMGDPVAARVSSVSEALRYVPGVNTEPRAGRSTGWIVWNIRGF